MTEIADPVHYSVSFVEAPPAESIVPPDTIPADMLQYLAGLSLPVERVDVDETNGSSLTWARIDLLLVSQAIADTATQPGHQTEAAAYLRGEAVGIAACRLMPATIDVQVSETTHLMVED